MATAQQVLNEARKWLGTTQGTANHKHIIDSYNRITPRPVGYAVSYYDHWCSTFITFIFDQVGASNLIGRECGVERHIGLFKSKGIWIEDGRITPQVGDIITYNWDDSTQPNDGWADHIGIVESVANGKITVIEGNIDRKVGRRVIPVGYGYIRGYARPKYEAQANASKTEKTQPKVSADPGTRSGIDISYWQNPKLISYDLLSKNIDFAILRVGYTSIGDGKTLNQDTAFETHYKELTNRGIPVGAYWYSCANTKAKGIAEANKCLEIIKGKKFGYPIYIDVEDITNQQKAGKSNLTEAVIGFCETIEAAGYYVGIYTTEFWLNNYMYEEKLRPYDKWIALWSNNKPGYKCGVWQRSSKGRLPGYKGDLDLNIAYRDYPSIIAKAGLNGFGKNKKVEVESAKKPPEPLKPIKTLKPIQTVAQEVINGKWGNGNDRVKALKAAGYNPSEVQNKVNELLKTNNSPSRSQHVSRSGWFEVGVASLNVRSKPALYAPIVARYSAGQRVYINDTLKAGGYIWGHYISFSRYHRYIALSPVGGNPYGKWVN